MKKFNLAQWALNHKQLVYYFIMVIFVAGIFSYQNLGRMEDPDFVIRQMVVSAAWPGATARQVEEQVTDKIEKKLQNTPGLDFLRSYSRPGQAVIYVALENGTAVEDIRPTWLEVRNMVNDIKGTLPGGVAGPYFNDRFDDVFGCIYAVTGDGYTYAEMHEKAEQIRRILLGVADVKKAELIGLQPEKVFITMESAKLSRLGIDPAVMISTVQAQAAMTPSGMLETSSDNVYLRVSGVFEDIGSIRNLPVRVGDSNLRLGDIAEVKRGYADPPEPKMFYNGQPAVGIALSMDQGGNILTLGENLEKTIGQIQKDLPLGLEIERVANQPQVVKDSINLFVRDLGLAVIVVLAVIFLSIGLRSGIVVALCIPLIICGVFAGMKMTGIDLHKVSLGALIIALGLLVDDAIITVEMFSVKLAQGWERFEAAGFAYTTMAFPCLTGTLITSAGFIPVGLSKGAAAEMVGSIFWVVSMALLISWVVAGAVAPLLGYGLLRAKAAPHGRERDIHDVYDTRFYRLFKKFLTWCLHHRRLVLGITVACFCGSVFLLGFVKQEFFPSSTRPELIVDLQLPEGTPVRETEREAQKFAAWLNDRSGIEHYSYYTGQSAPRFVLTAAPAPASTNFAQFVIVAKDTAARVELDQEVKQLFAGDFANVRLNTRIVQYGVADPYPVVLRVTGYDHDEVRRLAGQVRDVMAADPDLRNINLDWNEKNEVLRLEIDQDKARLLGISSTALASSLQTQLSGAPLAEFHEKDQTIGIVFRLDARDLPDLSRIKDLNIHIGGGQFVPLDHIAKISCEAEEGLIWRRDLKPAITVQAGVVPGVTGNDATRRVYNSLAELRGSLPPGYSINIGGALENSQKSLQMLLEPAPLMLFIIVTLLMFQLQSISKTFLTLLTAPLGIIGVAPALLLARCPMGFVVQMGILALSGIIIRNSIILIDQIERQIKAGESVWNAIINAAVFRFRPIMLTAAATILGMTPLVFNEYFGPMAVAIVGGLFVATVLTLLVLPAMYAAWFKIKPEAQNGSV